MKNAKNVNVFVSGARGFLGRCLLTALEDIRDKGECFQNSINIGDIYACDVDSSVKYFDDACANADFVFSLGTDYDSGLLIDGLIRHKNTCPVMFGVDGAGRGRFLEYGRDKGVKVLECNTDVYSELSGVGDMVYDMINAMQMA